MAEIILTNVLNTKVSIAELFKWLTADNPEEIILPDIVQNGSTRTEFVSYFLNFLREQCKSILPEVKDMQDKPSTELLTNKSQNESAAKCQESFSGDVQGSPCQAERPGVPPNLQNNEYKLCHSGQPVFQSTFSPQGPMACYIAPSVGGQTAPMSPMMRSPINSGQPVFQPRFPQQGVPPSVGGQASPMSTMVGNPVNMRMPPAYFPRLPHEFNNISPNPNPMMYQMPHPMLQANFRPAGPQFPQHQGNFNPHCLPQAQQAMPPRHYLNNFEDGKFPMGSSSPCNSPAASIGSLNSSVNQAQVQMGNLNISSPSGRLDNSFSNASAETSSPHRLDNSVINGSSILNASNTPFSPMSPLYANNISTLCPRRADKSHNETGNSQDFSSKASSTPKNGSGQKAAKSGQNHNRCLGDFMKTETPGSKKNSKKQMKVQLLRRSQGETVSPANEQKSTRRINPTRLDVSGDADGRGKEVFGAISRPTVANPKFVEAPSTDKSEGEVSFEVERGLLKLERQRQPKNEATNEKTNVEQKSSSNAKRVTTIVPRLDLVENIEILNILARLYSDILKRNLMTNPMTELYFLVTLLTTQYKKLNEVKSAQKKRKAKSKSSKSVQLLESLKDDLGCAELTEGVTGEVDEKGSTNGDEEAKDEKATEEELSVLNSSRDSAETPLAIAKKDSEEYLGTPHNCVYFASTVILDQQFLLSTLDRVTLKLLCENQQIAAFQPELQKYLNEIYRVKCLQSNRMKQSDSRNLQTNVCFQVDTDNRETFPSLVAFSLFRKQRDLFYDILKSWEDCHLTKGWVFQNALKNKINALLTIHTDPVNYCHFAKLFISQLLVSSVQSGQAEDPMDDESLSFLKSLKHLNPEKLMQLKERLVTPLTSTGPVPQPVFPGVQEFYREFILNASNWKFYVILEMSFIREIAELNETHFACSEIEGTGTTVDEITKQNFITCVSSLRLLAKFLSFTVSLPFRSSLNSPEWFGLQIQLRSRSLPSLDLRGSLVDALIHKRLSLTIPWIVQYMAMLDAVTLRLPYYIDVGELLYCIYRISNHSYLNDSDESMSPQAATLMMFTIGWLFDLPNFPRDIHAYWQMSYDAKKLKILGRSNCEKTNSRELTSVDAESSKEFVKYNSNLDKLDIIDDHTLYECCPFLAEFKILLISGNAVIGNNNANRHITPVSSQLSQPTFGVKTKNLQMQLEEAFFHGQPSSIRKTVDFVAERVASSCVKYICNSIVPSAKERNMKEFIKSKNGKLDLNVREEEEDEDKSPSSPEKSPTKSSKKARAEQIELVMQGLATTIMEDVKKECQEKISDMCEKRTLTSIESLLADDVFPCVKETCIAITRRIATERIDQWIDSHVVESLFLKHMTLELKRMLKEGDVDLAEKENHHNPDAPWPTEVIVMIRNSMWELLEKKGRWSELSIDSVSKTLSSLQKILTERADLVDNAEKHFYTMSVEYCLLLMSNRQDLYSVKIQQQFLDIWKINKARGSKSDDLFVRIISPRNIRLLTHKSQSAVRVFGRLLKGLLKEDLLSIEALSEQCVALFRQEWPTPILKQLSQCLNDVVSDYKSSNAHAEGVRYLLGWIASTCEEMEICDYD